MEHYDVGRLVGRGGFATVHAARDRRTGARVAIRSVRVGRDDERRRAMVARETAVHASLPPHPHVATLREVLELRDENNVITTVMMVMEHCRGGDLQSHVRRVRAERRRLLGGDEHGSPTTTTTTVSEEETAHVMRGVLSGLSFLHARGIVHRDVKASNVLLQPLAYNDRSHDNDGCSRSQGSWRSQNSSSSSSMLPDLREFSVKISDLGLAVQMGDDDDWDENQHTLCGTPSCLAPEVALSSSGDDGAEVSGHGRPADLWSTGCVLYALLVGRYPFSAGGGGAAAAATGQDDADRGRRIRNTVSRALRGDWAVPDDAIISAHASSLLDQLLSLDPKARGTAKELLESHPFLREDDRQPSREQPLLQQQEQSRPPLQGTGRVNSAADVGVLAQHHDTERCYASSLPKYSQHQQPQHQPRPPLSQQPHQSIPAWTTKTTDTRSPSTSAAYDSVNAYASSQPSAEYPQQEYPRPPQPTTQLRQHETIPLHTSSQPSTQYLQQEVPLEPPPTQPPQQLCPRETMPAHISSQPSLQYSQQEPPRPPWRTTEKPPPPPPFRDDQSDPRLPQQLNPPLDRRRPPLRSENHHPNTDVAVATEVPLERRRRRHRPLAAATTTKPQDEAGHDHHRASNHHETSNGRSVLDDVDELIAHRLEGLHRLRPMRHSWTESAHVLTLFLLPGRRGVVLTREKSEGGSGRWMHVTGDGLSVSAGRLREGGGGAHHRDDADSDDALVRDAFARAPLDHRRTEHHTALLYKPLSSLVRHAKHARLYRTLHRVVGNVRERTPKITLYLHRPSFAEHDKLGGLFAKTLLMENAPSPDVVTDFVDGASVRHRLGTGAIETTSASSEHHAALARAATDECLRVEKLLRETTTGDDDPFPVTRTIVAPGPSIADWIDVTEEKKEVPPRSSPHPPPPPPPQESTADSPPPPSVLRDYLYDDDVASLVPDDDDDDSDHDSLLDGLPADGVARLVSPRAGAAVRAADGATYVRLADDDRDVVYGLDRRGTVLSEWAVRRRENDVVVDVRRDAPDVARAIDETAGRDVRRTVRRITELTRRLASS